MVRLLYANSGSILLNPQANYTVLSETPFSQGEKKKKELKITNLKGALR